MGKKGIQGLLAVVMSLVMLISITGIQPNTANAATTKKTVNSITVSNLPAKTLTLAKGKKFKLKTKVSVSGGASKAVTYKSTKPGVVTVSKKGVLTAKKKGKATVVITSKANKKKKLSIKVTVGTPAKKVSITGSHTVIMNKTIKLKATVSSKKTSNKKVVWTSSNKSVATVTSAGYVKGLKAGKTVIKATAADGSGKKASFVVTVLEPVKIEKVNVLSSSGIEVVLKNAKQLTASNFEISNSCYLNGTNARKCIISKVTTKDYKTYIITIKGVALIEPGTYAKVFVKDSIGSDSKAVLYSGNICTYNTDIVFEGLINESFNEQLGVDSINKYSEIDCGFLSFTSSNLPSGINAKIVNNGKKVEIYGVIKEKGTYKSTIVCKDELGNTYNFNVTFIIGTASDIIATSISKYYVANTDNTRPVCHNNGIYASGGSGNYLYELEEASDYFSVNSENGYIIGTAPAGTYDIKVRVYDEKNYDIYAIVTVRIVIEPSICLRVTLKDLNGKNLEDGIYVTLHDKNAVVDTRYLYEASYSYSSEGEVFITGFPAGTYDLQLYCYGTEYILYNQKITKTENEINATMPGYLIKLSSSLPEFSAGKFGEWWGTDDIIYGQGEYLFLPEGTHNLRTQEIIDGGYLYSAMPNIKVTKGMNTATLSVTKQSLDSISTTIIAGRDMEITLEPYSKSTIIKCTPQETGYYYFYTEGDYDTYGEIYSDSGKLLKYSYKGGEKDNFYMGYQCTIFNTYYIRIYNERFSSGTHHCNFKVIKKK